MNKNLLYLFLALCCFSCSKDNSLRNNNPYLPKVSFNLQLDLNLPEYNNLNFPGNSYVTYNYGIKGVVVYNINNSQYTAFELSDPNHQLQDCSRLTVNGVIATCHCDDGNQYNILTGELTSGTGQYALKPYRVVKNGNYLLISN
ncbi:MAG: hypothetical protein WCD31_05680 [Gillisia sp.]